jgi:hypothetical protein
MNAQDRQRIMVCGCRVDGPTGIPTYICAAHERPRLRPRFFAPYRSEATIEKGEADIAKWENDQEEGRQ